MNIKEIIKKAHENAKGKGFYDCPVCGTPDNAHHSAYCLDSFTDMVRQKNIGELLMLVVSELSEALEAHRRRGIIKVNLDNIETLKDKDEFMIHFERHIKDGFQDELADAVIRICDLCGYLNIDLERHIQLKMQYNETIEYKHGKRY